MGKYVQTPKEFARNLKFFRNYIGITQQEIADELGVERSTYSYYETGRTFPSLFTLGKIADMFDVNVDLLISRDLFDDGNPNLMLWKDKQHSAFMKDLLAKA